MSAIAWESFSSCGHRTRMDNAPTRSKLVHNWLNLGVQSGKHESARQYTLRGCPYCASSEDFEHLQSCRSPQAMTARCDATVVLKKALGDSVGGNSIFVQSHNGPSIRWSYQLSRRVSVAISWLLIALSNPNLTLVGCIYLEVSLASPGEHCFPTALHMNDKRQGNPSQQSIIWQWSSELSKTTPSPLGKVEMKLHANTEASAAILHAQLHHKITTMYDLKDTFSPSFRATSMCHWTTDSS
ncbi:hypothetical protein MHU86_18401 [Fragilaria crotonensis]|nr:hypothetical protein MHU86_18401 [Fragilaria crotonensis]